MSFAYKNIPNASILINSMRSIGYDFETAVADILDNSITAGASNISLNFSVDDKVDPYLLFFDNGKGMNRDELIEAMRFGSIKDTERDSNDLGRFGLGLKTASISQCKKFTVISKKDHHINGFFWDLDLIDKESGWDMYELDKNQFVNIPFLEEHLLLESFTVVYWEKLDKLQQDVSFVNTLYDIFTKKIHKTEKHISLVFHRYIESGLNISINNNRIDALDPFLSYHPKTTIKPEQVINTKTKNGYNAKVKLQVYVLPYHKDLTNKDYEKLGGNDNLDDQGFYVYRNNRLMIYGTWFKIKPKQELSKNARIKVDIPNSLDDLWSIDIKKQKAVIPGQLLEQLRGEVSFAVEKSKRLHEYKGEIQTKDGSIWTKIVDERENSVSYKINQSADIIEDLIESLDDRSASALGKIIELIELSLPYKDIYNSVSSKKEINVINDSQVNFLISQALVNFWEMKKRKNMKDTQIVDLICSYEPYHSANIRNILLEKINER